ncbi:MAG: hypothetical protein AB7P02_07590 [Alphaproteobacteria bacterium]
MRKLLLVLLLCLMPGLAFAQSAPAMPAAPAAPPSITITPPSVALKGVTAKHVLIVTAAVVGGALFGEAIVGSLVGDALGTLVGAAGGYFLGAWLATEDETM